LFLWGATLAVATELGGGWKEKRNPDGKVVQELKIEAPTFTEEDQYGYVMPERYRCDSCRAVMFHLDQELRKKHPRSRRMKQWEFTDVFDETCRSALEGYGIRLVDGENALSGPGLRQAEQLAPGSGAIQMGGESWSKRLGEVCRKIVYEKVGEEDIYERFYEQFRTEGTDAAAASRNAAGGLGHSLCVQELRECVTGPRPMPKQREQARVAGKGGAEKRRRPATPKATTAAPATVPPPAQPALGTAATGAPASAAVQPSPAAGPVDLQAFLRALAVRHGLTSDEYLVARTPGEWERLFLGIASRIFGLAASEHGTCSAG